MEDLEDIFSCAGKASFVDASVSTRTQESKTEVIRLEHEIGYRRFCLNTEVDSIWTPNAGKKKKKKGEEECTAPACPVPPPSKPVEQLEDDCKSYNRLTFPLTDPIQLNKMNTPNILSYDILAVEPMDEKLLHKVCTESEHVDLVTFNFLAGNAPRFKIQPGVIKVAQERGIHFEISIGPGLRSLTDAKQSLISYARKIVTATKGKNVILSVGALRSGEVRGPYDLMNLGVLFGMSQSQAKDAVTKNFDSMLRHSLSRKSGGGVVTFTRRVDCTQKTKEQLSSLKNIKSMIATETMPTPVSGRQEKPRQSEAKLVDDEVKTDPLIVSTKADILDKRKAMDHIYDRDNKKPRLADS